MNSILAFFMSFGAPESPTLATDMEFLKTPAQLESFCDRRYTFEEERKACKDKALFIGLDKTEACANFSKMSVDRETCLAAAGDGTSVEVLRYCAGHEFSMNKKECLSNKAQKQMSADFTSSLTNGLDL